MTLTVSPVRGDSSQVVGNVLFTPTALGTLAVAFDGEAVQRLCMGYRTQSQAEAAIQPWSQGEPAPRAFIERVSELLILFAEGEPVDLAEIPTADFPQTEFQRAVRAACLEIPWGETRTYAALAAEVGRPRAARAVGGVMAANPTPLIVPCHRVLGSGGKLTGFSAPDGVHLKRRLLDLEGFAG